MLALGAVSSWTTARVQSLVGRTPNGSAGSSAIGHWRAIPTPSNLEWFLWEGWIWEMRETGWFSGNPIRRIAQWPGNEGLTRKRPPYWSAASNPEQDFPRAAIGWNAFYEVEFGWPLPCLVSEDVEYPTDPKDPTSWTSVSVLHGARYERLKQNPIANLSWMAFPWLTVEGSEQESVPAFIDTHTEDGVRTQTPTASFLPTRVVWLGLLADSLIHGACLLMLWWSIVGLGIGARYGIRFALRNSSRSRARRGACRACGHQLAGLKRCPECGAPR